MTEWILQPSEQKSLFPISPIFQAIYLEYKKQQSTFWVVDEIDLTEDVVDWNSKLTESEREFICIVLAFFAIADGPVAENLVNRFIQDVPHQPVQLYWIFQAMIEGVHSETYSMLVDTLIQDPVKRDQLFNATAHYPVIRKKSEWIDYWMASDKSFAERLLAFAAVEGIFFSASFCSIHWLKMRGVMPGLCFSNDLISRDEGSHRDTACMMYRDFIQNKLETAAVYQLIDAAVSIELEFVKDALPINLLGMNQELMGQYVKYVADHLLQTLQLEPYYKVTNPFTWMESISLPVKTNYFERRNHNYMKSAASTRRGTVKWTDDF